MLRVACIVALVALAAGCAPSAWRPALVVSLTAIDARRVSPIDERVAERWDVRAAATLVLVPRPPRHPLRPERPPRRDRQPDRTPFPCAAAWLCVWERAARADALARWSALIPETVP